MGKVTASVMIMAGVIMLSAGCMGARPKPKPPIAAAPFAARATASAKANPSASATLQPLLGTAVRGVITFTNDADGVLVTGRIEGLRPNSAHGFHVHERGDCSAPDGNSAGGHFNPTGVKHGAPNNHASHAGDLGNLHSDAQGVAMVEVHKPGVSLLHVKTTFVGRGLIVHAAADDLASQPAGNSGVRIACAVIQAQ